MTSPPLLIPKETGYRVTSLFSTPEQGILEQSSQAMEAPNNSLLALDVPFFLTVALDDGAWTFIQ